MKTSQWVVAYVVLVVLVFGIVFIVNYVGDPAGSSGKTETPTISTEQLIFPLRTTTPEPGRYVREAERGSEGHADFWFFNPHDKVVSIGLNRLACRCSSVELWLAPAAILRERAAEAAGLVGEALGTASIASTLLRVAATEHSERAAGLEHRCEMRQLQTAALDVPVGALGWVRIKWKNKDAGRQKLDAQLWYSHPELGPKVVLESHVHFHEAFTLGVFNSKGQLTREIELPDTAVERLPRHETIFAWSSTRDTLNLEVKNVPLGQSTGEDTFTVDPPEALSPSEVEAFQGRVGGVYDSAPIRCVYRIRYTMNARSADGKNLFDQGLYQRRVEVRLKDHVDEPQTFIVRGVIQGDIRVSGSRELAEIDLGTFEMTIGSRPESRTLVTALPNLNLEIDPTRTSPFVRAELETPRPTADGGKSWVLRVRVEPNKVRGRFPRLDDPAYQDAAIYLRSVGGEGRTLRIPFRGTATQ